MPNTQKDDFDLEQLIVKFDPEKLDPSLWPVKPIHELAQSAAASTPPITAAAPSHASVRADMKAAKKSVQNRIKDLMHSDPILSKFKSKHYGVQVNATSFMKGKEGSSKVFAAIINHILTQSGAVKSQTHIRSYVAEMFPSYTVPKDWTKPLTAWAVKNVKQHIENSAAPISNIQVPKAVTLSQLHAAARAAMERHKTGAQTFKPLVQVSDTSVVINGIAFPISNNIVKGEAYKQVRASMLKLHKALELGK